jgi:hypothetical protein
MLRAILATGLLTVVNIPAIAWAETSLHPHLTAKYIGDFGVFFSDRDLKISVNGSLGDVNESIDFSNELRRGRSDEVFALEFSWRFSEKWSLRTQYFESGGSTSAVLNEDVEWGDVVFGSGSNIDAGSDFSLVRLFFRRAFNIGERHDLGLGLGIHRLEFGGHVEGEAIINGMPAGFQRRSVSAHAPLPNIGIDYVYSLSPRWALRARLDWISASIDDYSGGLVNTALGLNYKVTDHIGLGVSYNVFDLDLDVSKSSWNGEISTRYTGGFLNASVFW